MKRLVLIAALAAGLAACRDRQPPVRVDAPGQASTELPAPQRVTGGEVTFESPARPAAPDPYSALRSPERRVEARTPSRAPSKPPTAPPRAR